MDNSNIRPWPELQALIPPLSTKERKQLSDSIASDGVLVPITVLPDGRIIDGHHRWELSGENAPVNIQDVTEDEGMALGLVLNLARRHLSPEQVAEVYNSLRHNRKLRKTVALKAVEAGKTHAEAAALVGVNRSVLTTWEHRDRQERGEGTWRMRFADEVNGNEEVATPIGPADVQTETHVYEVEPVHSWKRGMGQALAYAAVTSLAPGLYLYGPEPHPEKLQRIQDIVEGQGIELRLNLWQKKDKLPGR